MKKKQTNIHFQRLQQLIAFYVGLWLSVGIVTVIIYHDDNLPPTSFYWFIALTIGLYYLLISGLIKTYLHLSNFIDNY